MRTHATCLLLAGLSACAPLSDYEAETLAARAIVDARAQPARLHRAYLDCYALPRATKRRCIAVITPNAASRVAARSRTFATAFDHEAERLGFRAFPQANGKACASVDHGPLFDADLGAYRVECADGNHYRMRYAVETGWTLLPSGWTEPELNGDPAPTAKETAPFRSEAPIMRMPPATPVRRHFVIDA